MSFDPVAVLNSFSVADGVLYRRHLNGTMSRVSVVHSGRLAVTFQGQRLDGTAIAWLCHHLFPCPYLTVAVDGNPHNMSLDNVMPVRRRRIVFRPATTKHGYRHSLSQICFPTVDKARLDWVHRARAYYMDDRMFLLSQSSVQAQRQQIIDAVGASDADAPMRRKFKPAKKHVARPPMPPVPEGMECHWYNDAWIVIPMAVHCSDDWMVRAEACLKNPQARFVFDPVSQRTVEASHQ